MKMLTLLVHLVPFLGIDVNIKDNRGLTALDTVRELPSQKSQQIAALIEGTVRLPFGGAEGTLARPRHLYLVQLFVCLFFVLTCRSHDWKKNCKRAR